MKDFYVMTKRIKDIETTTQFVKELTALNPKVPIILKFGWDSNCDTRLFNTATIKDCARIFHRDIDTSHKDFNCVYIYELKYLEPIYHETFSSTGAYFLNYIFGLE